MGVGRQGQAAGRLGGHVIKGFNLEVMFELGLGICSAVGAQYMPRIELLIFIECWYLLGALQGFLCLISPNAAVSVRRGL